jgi:hypothetical protein
MHHYHYAATELKSFIVALKYLIQFRYVTEAFSLCSDIAGAFPLLLDH